MALTEELLPPQKKGPSLVIQIVVLLVMTLAAVGGGWAVGMYLKSGVTPPPPAAAEAEAPAADAHGAPADAHGKEAEKDKAGGHGGAASSLMTDLAPITTNLAAPSQVWVRMEAAIVTDTPQPPELAEKVHQDLLAYLRTLKLHQIEGPSGYQHLKADLDERARIRSDGHVTQVLIKTLLFE